MSEEIKIDNEKPVPALGPYEDIYIYLLSGMVREKEEMNLGDAFIGNWVEDKSSFLFFSRPSQEIVIRLLDECADLELVDDYRFSYEEWQGGGLDPVQVDLFSIIPPWLEAESNGGVAPIILDPGVVFGNGLHPTTGDCLRALSFAQRQKPIIEVLDLGTGTGILALAAARLGAKHVLAVDLNPLCVKTAMANVKQNQLTGVIDVVEGPADKFITGSADLVVANIHFDVVEGLLNAGALAVPERVILSGLMRSQFRKIKVLLEKQGFYVVREWDHEMTWYTTLACRLTA